MYEYDAVVERVVDGDTVDVLIDLGFRTFVRNRLRLFGIDTPEVRTRDLVEKAKGKEASAALVKLLETYKGKIRIVSHGLDKYGRCLATIWVQEGLMGRNVNEWLLTEGHAEEYKP